MSVLAPPVSQDVDEGQPIFVNYPDLAESSELTLGAGVYFPPAVTMEKIVKAPLPNVAESVSEAMQGYETFVQQAHEFSELFGGPAKLDPTALKRIWGETKTVAAADRIDWAIAQFLLKGIPDTQETDFSAPFDDFHKKAANESKWKSARGVFFSQRMKGITAKRLHFSVEPALPAGLVLSSRTGVISGKPSAVAPLQAYVVKVESEAGNGDNYCCETKVEIVVNDFPPKNLKYPQVENNVILTGQPIAWAPEVEGSVDRWQAREALPAGIVLDKNTGVICGVPLQLAPEKTYTIIAKNSQGSTSTQVTLSVVRGAPAGLLYHSEATVGVAEKRGLCGNSGSFFYAVDRALRLYPSVEGEVDAYKITPALPPGLEFSTTNGVISGTPTTVTPNRRYVVTASNETGSCNCNLMFEIKVVQTESLTYPEVDELYAVGEQVVLAPTVVGSVINWTVDPSLPPGLELDLQTGQISGTPTEVCDETEYTVAASSEAGGTSCVLTFAVIMPAPKGLHYPSVVAEYNVGQAVQLEPGLSEGLAARYEVEPALPPGLTLDASTGVISGETTAAASKTDYNVTASGSGGSCVAAVTFSVQEVMMKKAPSTPVVVTTPKDDEFSARIENIVDLADMPVEPSKADFPRFWMVWMVHRAQLDDPTLTKLSFNQMSMPLPKDEPRISPKLMRAISVNTHITDLDLSHSNLRPQEGLQLAASLRTNSTVQSLNVDGNHLNQDSIHELAVALTDSRSITSWSCQSQLGMGSANGKSVEQAVANLATENGRITRLGFQFRDEHLANVVDTAIRRNRDALRRQRKKSALIGHRVEEKQFSQLILNRPPDKSIKEFFPSDEDNTAIIRKYISDKGRMPTKEQLQAFAKREGKALKYSEVAPLVRNFRKVLLDALNGMHITALDVTKASFEGSLAQWSEKNESWSVTITALGDDVIVQYHFTSRKDIIIDISEDVRIWLWHEATPAAQ